ncbi:MULTISPECIES: RHS repeat domain-containing protein [unclassified Polaromonas]|uniref:RHS repeat domain-containing protein n=1 Tax=unclassified Polaromonas TaxID=2638319 RepID=UPI000F08ACDB|nr:hypothetical protein DT070_16840 [Polaromonas sp. SP1]QGJ19352.1 hypothetical protein F7R28_13750 [Polaromonas sp. Pch-P]
MFDAESGLFQNWHREYCPRCGRYMQFDPTGLADGPNGFIYAKGNPLCCVALKLDPLGQFPLKFNSVATYETNGRDGVG